MSTRLVDTAKVAGERGLVRGDDDGRARVNEGNADPQPPVSGLVEAYAGDVGSPAIRTHAPYISPVNSAAYGPTKNSQVASDDDDIETIFGVGAGDPQPPVSGDVEDYAGNVASPAIHTHGPYVANVNNATNAPGNDTDDVDEPAGDPRPPTSGEIEFYKGNVASPDLDAHAPYTDPVNDGSTEDTYVDASADE